MRQSHRWRAGAGLAMLVAMSAGACATGSILGDDAGVDAAPAQDAAKDSVVLPLDGSSDGPGNADAEDAPIDVFDAGCAPADAGLGGIGIPSGSSSSATTTYSTNTADLAIDGNLGSYWNAGDVTGSLTLTLPSAQSITGVRIEAVASPASSETYTITGYQGGTPFVIATSNQSVPQGATALPTIPVTPGAYESIRIDVTSSPSWVAIAEVSLVTAYCP
jgi:hypothetical protein